MDAAPPPSSPGVPPVQLKDCIEELLRFTLLCSLKNELDTGLSDQYCANLLADDLSDSLQTNNETSEGIPSYPLYKRIASSLYQFIHSRVMCVADKDILPVIKDVSFKTKDEWDDLIVDKGPCLLRMLEAVDFELHVQEPFFSQLNDGVKTVEGRCAAGNYKRMQPGNLLLFNKCLLLLVKDVRSYGSFHEMLEAESLAKVLPGTTSIENGVKIYRNFYSEEKEKSNGVLAIHVETPASRLNDVMASILSGLSYGGIQALLGFVQTTGTFPEWLPPPASTLLSTFLAPHNPDVKGSKLTGGARALAKHVNRSSEGYWGAFRGSDSEKNKHALDAISRLLTQCRWMNIHIVPPHGIVFEIRSSNGYGARWSGEGTKFIGFLEPYRVDGRSSGWKH